MLDTYYSSSIEYNGPDIEALGIKNGQGFNDVMTKVGDFVKSINDIASQCKSCGDAKKFPDVIKDLYQKVNNPKASDIKYDGSVPSVGLLSTAAAELNKAQMSYNVDLEETTSKFTFDNESIKAVIPEGYKITSMKTTVTGQGSGQNTVLSSKGMSGGVDVPLSRYPLTVETRTVVNNGSGDIELTKSFVVKAESGRKDQSLDVKDRSSNEKADNVSSYIDLLTNNISRLNQEVLAIKSAK